MKDMILIDIETRTFDISYGGIYEVGLLVVKNNSVVDRLHLGIVENEEELKLGMGYGYKEISNNEDMKFEFKNFISKYNLPLAAHNATFDRKFLVYHNWIEENREFYDTVRAIKYANTKLISYSLAHLLDFAGIKDIQKHTAMDDLEDLFRVLQVFNPKIWLRLGKNKNLSGKDYTKEVLEKNFEIIKDLFAGKNMIFTGKGPFIRKDLIELAKKCGAICNSNSVTKKTEILVVGEDAGSKLEKAKELGIEIMPMSDFFEMTNGIKLDEREANFVKNLISEEVILSNKLENKTFSFVPMKLSLAQKCTKLVQRHGGIGITTLRQKETTTLVYQPYGEEMATVQRARSKNIKVMTLGEFNKFIIDLEGDEF